MFEESGREGGERIVGSAFTYGSSARYSDYSVHTFDINEYKFWNGIYWYIQYIPVYTVHTGYTMSSPERTYSNKSKHRLGRNCTNNFFWDIFKFVSDSALCKRLD